jgi:hypothetical protein
MGERLKHEIREDYLPQEVGLYHLMLPYFQLPEGESLAYFDSGGRIPDDFLGFTGFQPDFTIGSDLPAFHFGWRGMNVDSFGWNNNAPDVARLVHGQVDWLSEEVGKISVSRNEFEFSRDVGWQMQVELRNLAQNWIRDFLDQHASSAYHLINCHLAGMTAAPPARA